MCNVSGALFGARVLEREEAAGRRVLEVGAYDLNGSLRPLVESWSPGEYVGVDVAFGPGVDVLCPAEELVARFGEARFDLVIATELIEHVRDWRAAVSAMKRVLAPQGVLLVTTRSQGFPYHGAPADYWRYELSDFEDIFADLTIEALETDPMRPGVFLKARRPDPFAEASLEAIALYNVLTRTRTLHVTDAHTRSLRALKLALKDRLVSWALKRGKSLFHRL